LEEILIGENVARWTRRHDAIPSGEDDAPGIAWEEIDWDSVRHHPRFAAYGTLGGPGAAAGSDLAAYLDALSRAVRELAEPDTVPVPQEPAASPGPLSVDDGSEDEVLDESDLSGGVEGVEVDDVVEDDANKTPAGRRQSVEARNLRLIRNFVRRNLRALEQSAFREGAGSGIVIPNVIVLNWVCWWVATKDDERPGELVDERLRLWRMLWGDNATPGYLDELTAEHQGLVLKRFDEQWFEPVTLASMVDIWSHTESYSDSHFRALRSVVRRAVAHPCWQVVAHHLQPATRLINGRPTTPEALDPVGVVDILWDAACTPVGDSDARTAIADAVGVEQGVVSMSQQAVVVDDTSIPRRVSEAFVAGQLSQTSAERALVAWQGIEDRDYYRLKWDGGVALLSMASS